MKKLNPVQRVLTKAKDYLVEYGWVQNDDGNKKVGFCASAAIEAVTKNVNLRREAHRIMANTVGRTFSWNGDVDAVVQFNDRYNVKKRDVINAFRRAITKAGKS